MAIQILARLTGYWPYQAGLSDAQRLMEGGHTDKDSHPLYTLEMYQRGEAPYVSVAGDDSIWPYGQRIEIDAWPGVVFRVVDTGGNFRGANKQYREAGREPLDICVDSSSSRVPKRATVTIVEGDMLPSRKGPRALDFTNLRGQSPTVVDSVTDSLENAAEDVAAAVGVEIDADDPTTKIVLVSALGLAVYWALEAFK